MGKMILVADSGSTKTDWRLIDENTRKSVPVSSEGLNPYFLSEDEIAAIVAEKVLPVVANVDRIYFYGAGCGLPMKARQVKDALDRVIPTPGGAMVTGDTLAAARSLLQNSAGVCCILGTGSNGFVYDGTQIKTTVPSLGYMFSDWGSGTVLGKDFLGLVLQERLPVGIRKDFELTFRYNRMQILENIYNKPMANRFMSSFTPFIYKYAEEDSIRNIILENFRRFFSYYVLQYEEFASFRKVSMVGSIAYHFKKYLFQVGEEMNIGIEKVVKNPMDGLVEYHCNQILVAENSGTANTPLT